MYILETSDGASRCLRLYLVMKAIIHTMRKTQETPMTKTCETYTEREKNKTK